MGASSYGVAARRSRKGRNASPRTRSDADKSVPGRRRNHPKVAAQEPHHALQGDPYRSQNASALRLGLQLPRLTKLTRRVAMEREGTRRTDGGSEDGVRNAIRSHRKTSRRRQTATSSGTGQHGRTKTRSPERPTKGKVTHTASKRRGRKRGGTSRKGRKWYDERRGGALRRRAPQSFGAVFGRSGGEE